MDFKLDINADEIARQLNADVNELNDKLQEAVAGLAAQCHAKVIELANQQLHSTREEYIKNLDWFPLNEHTYVVVLREPALWIEEGMCVVYADGSTKIPTVLTPEGELPITKVKKGTRVLNRYGKWTKVEIVIDQLLLEESVMGIEKVRIRNTHTHRLNTHVIATCPTCGYQKKYSKFHTRSMVTNKLVCPECRKHKQLVTIKLCSPHKNKRLVLTEGHPVFTQRGWIRAGDLTTRDVLMTPSWSVCEQCKTAPTKYGSAFCGSKCGAGAYQDGLLERGEHQSQSEEWLSNVYRKSMKNLKRISGVEEVVASILESTGHSVEFYKKNNLNSADCIRQFPVRREATDKIGRPRYYFLDFYFPKLKLAIEVDGAAFHDAKKDQKRDAELKMQGIDTYRLPASKVRYKGYAREYVAKILANHEGFITYLPVTISKIRKFTPSGDSPLKRRWDIKVEEGASFVCQGVLIHNSPHSMVDDLLKNNPKISKEGKRYKSIPFKHAEPESKTPTALRSLEDTLRQELKKRKIPITKIEKDPVTGLPKLGLVHRFNIDSKQKGPTGIPFLHGVSVYQHQQKSSGSVTKSIMTFRTVSEDHKAQGRWFHPGLESKNFLDQAFRWASAKWENEILPALLKG